MTPVKTIKPTLYETAVANSASNINDTFGQSHPVAVILGSGYDSLVSTFENSQTAPMEKFGIPSPKASGHSPNVYSVKIQGTPTLVFGGRIHTYKQGQSFDDVTFAVRAAISAGAKAVFLTNAAGGVKNAPGSFVFHSSSHYDTGLNFLDQLHASLMFGRHIDPDTSYHPALIQSALEACKKAGIDNVDEGRYLMFRGPMYEQSFYVEAMVRLFGIDLFGMSTVPSHFAAHAMGAQVLSMSTVSNWAKGYDPKNKKALVSHDEVTDTLSHTTNRLRQLLPAIVSLLANAPERPVILGKRPVRPSLWP